MEEELKKIKEFWSMPWESYQYHELRSHVADIEWLIKQIQEYQEWFEIASSNVQRKDKVIENQLKMITELESEIEKGC